MVKPMESLSDIIQRQANRGILPEGESVLEDRFWEMMRKTNLGLEGAKPQFEIGRFRVDAIVDCSGKSVVIELDGKQWHDPKADEHRDGILAQSVDAVIRIPFRCMWDTPRATFRAINEWYRDRFYIEDDHVVTEGELEYGLVPLDGHAIEVYQVYDQRARVGRVIDFIGAGVGGIITIKRGTGTPEILDKIHAK